MNYIKKKINNEIFYISINIINSLYIKYSINLIIKYKPKNACN